MWLFLALAAAVVIPGALIPLTGLDWKLAVVLAVVAAVLAGLVVTGPSGLATFYHQQLAGDPPPAAPAPRPVHSATTSPAPMRGGR